MQHARSRFGAIGHLALVVSLNAGCLGAIDDDSSTPSLGSNPPPGGGAPGAGQLPTGGGQPPPSSPPQPGTPGSSAGGAAGPGLPRLSHVQWENAANDLLRLEPRVRVADLLSLDPVAGFDSAGSAWEVSDELRTDYERTAESLADLVASTPERLARLLPPGAPSDTNGRLEALATELGRRAYRRPLDRTELDELLQLARLGPTSTKFDDPLAAGATLLIRALLQSPHFVYRLEVGAAASDGRVVLSPWELASKLAFTLTNTMPDEMLLSAAERGALKTRQDRLREAQRLVRGPAGLLAIDGFSSRWLQTGKYGNITVKDTKLFPEWNAIRGALPADVRSEALAFTREIFMNDLGLRDLLTAPFSFVNQRLAALYGLSGSFPEDKLVRAPLPAEQRAGIFTQIGALASRAGATQPDPVHRGLFVIESVFCGVVPPPLPNVTPPPVVAAKTNRQLWEAQTHQGACKGCHQELINPVGFAFEGYDALGRVRRTDAGQPIDASGFFRFPSSGEKRFDGVVELARMAAETPEAHECFASHLFSFVHGRAPQASDDAEVKALARRLGTGELSWQAAILELVTNEGFFSWRRS